MVQGLYTVEEVSLMIEKGEVLLLAGDAALLSVLPKGKWIAGVTSRFIENGKTLTTTREKIFVHNVTDVADDIKLKEYDASSISGIYDDAFDNGFSVLIMPFLSDVMNEYSVNCTNYSNFASRAVCGWISVAPVYSEYERNDVSLVFSGESGASYTDVSIAMHIGLSADRYAEIHAFSPFKPEKNGDVIVFEENGHQVEYALINGTKQNFRQYLLEKSKYLQFVSRECLVGDFSGIHINVAISAETEKDVCKYVSFGTPVHKGIPYRFAVADNDNSYDNSKQTCENVFSLSCITNFIYPDIFLKYLTQTNGPFVYGEIAYFLLNNDTVYVTVGNLQDK